MINIKSIFHVNFKRENFEFLLQTCQANPPSSQVNPNEETPIQASQNTIYKVLDLLLQAQFDLSQDKC